MKVSAQYAEDHIADLFLAARSGEEVEIVAPDNLTLKLIVTECPAPPAQNGGRAQGAGRRHLFGAGKGLVTPPTDEEWDTMKKQLASEMLDRPFIPPEQD